MTASSRQSTNEASLSINMWICTTLAVACFGLFLVMLTHRDLFPSDLLRGISIGLPLAISAILAGEIVSKLFKVLETKQ